MSAVPTVYLVDDDPGALRSLCWLVGQAGLSFRAFSSGRQFLDEYRSSEPGCLVLDVRMPEMGGLDVQQRLLEVGLRMPIIFVTAHGDVPTCAQAFRSGAIDFLEKPVDAEVFLARIRKALARGVQQAEIAARMNELTPRESEVVKMLVSGKTIKEIASVNRVRTETIWKHRDSILTKLRVANDVELARLVSRWQDHETQ